MTRETATVKWADIVLCDVEMKREQGLEMLTVRSDISKDCRDYYTATTDELRGL